MFDKLVFILSLILPGSGHLMLKKYKGFLLGLVYSIFVVFAIIVVIIPSFDLIAVYQNGGDYEGMYTIGKEEYIDNSFTILVQAIFAAFLVLVIIGINLIFAFTAKRTNEIIKSGETDLLEAKEIRKGYIPHIINSPIYALLLLFILIPAVTSIVIAFTNFSDKIIPPGFLISWSGFDSFKSLFNDPRYEGLFESTFVWTIIWSLSATLVTISLGMSLAVVLNNKKIKAKKFFRTIYLLPWAVPAFLTILIFKIFFSKIGMMNTVVLPLLSGSEYAPDTAVGFLIDENLAKATIILIQGWLGFPFVFVLTTGVLQAIPEDLYEASSIDGGGPWRKFWDITFPIIMISAAPLLITQFAFNFNNVTIIYLLGEGVVKDVGAIYGPLEIISSLGYRLTLDANFSMAAAVGLISSIIVSTFVLVTWIKTGAFNREEVM